MKRKSKRRKVQGVDGTVHGNKLLFNAGVFCKYFPIVFFIDVAIFQLVSSGDGLDR